MSKPALDVRQIGGAGTIALGALVLLSGLWINPLVAGLVKPARAVDFGDVLASYLGWSMFLGAVLIGLGVRLTRGPSRLDAFAVLIVLAAALIVLDRFLLTRFGLAMWTYDTEIWYRHRPNIVRTLGTAGRPDDRIVINRWGFHDTDFPREKPKGEFRVLAIGDSTTMGLGLTYAETYSAHLESLLAGGDRRHASHQVINAGVHGYSTYQQKRVLERSLAFAPDVVIIGFCLNDVTEPFVVNEKFGGIGLDYHHVVQVTNPVSGWLANETGLGRFLQSFINRGKIPQAEKRQEIYNVRRMTEESHSSPQMQEAWRVILHQLGEIYAIAAQRNLPVVLVVFPYTFQLTDAKLRAPQEILTQHAAAHKVDVIDTTEDFARAVFDDPDLVRYLRSKGKTADEILAYHRFRADRFFFDENHFTSAGNRIVAQLLFDYLSRKGLVGAAAGRAQAYSGFTEKQGKMPARPAS